MNDRDDLMAAVLASLGKRQRELRIVAAVSAFLALLGASLMTVGLLGSSLVSGVLGGWALVFFGWKAWTQLAPMRASRRFEQDVAKGLPLPLDRHLALFPEACQRCGCTAKESWEVSWSPQASGDWHGYHAVQVWCQRCKLNYREPEFGAVERPVIHVRSPFLAAAFSEAIPDPPWKQE